MAEQKHFAYRTVALFLVAGLFVFLLYLYFFVPLPDLIQTIKQVNPYYFLLALGALFISAVFYALTWQSLLNMVSVKASLLKTFQFCWVANFVDILVPAESLSGDLSRIYFMSKETEGNTGKVVASVLGHRVLGTFVTVAGLFISTIYFVIYYEVSLLVLEIIGIIAALNAIYIGLMFYVSARRETTEKIVDWIVRILARIFRGRLKPERLKESAMKALSMFYDGIAALSVNRKDLILPMFFQIFAWLFDVLIAVLVFLSMGSLNTAISLSAIVIVYTVSIVIHYIPVVSGELGIMEIVMTSMFTLLGNPQAIAVFAAATVLIRVLTLWVRLFVGGLIVQIMGIKSLLPSQTEGVQSNTK
jgi:uncharacterized protein (TIRG00374 family)